MDAIAGRRVLTLYLVLVDGTDASGSSYWPIQEIAGSEAEASHLACEEAERRNLTRIVIDEVEAQELAPGTASRGIAEVFGRNYYVDASQPYHTAPRISPYGRDPHRDAMSSMPVSLGEQR